MATAIGPCLGRQGDAVQVQRIKVPASLPTEKRQWQVLGDYRQLYVTTEPVSTDHVENRNRGAWTQLSLPHLGEDVSEPLPASLEVLRVNQKPKYKEGG